MNHKYGQVYMVWAFLMSTTLKHSLWVQIKTNPKIHIGGTFGQNVQQRAIVSEF